MYHEGSIELRDDSFKGVYPHTPYSLRKNNVYSPEALLKAHREITEEREAVSKANK